MPEETEPAVPPVSPVYGGLDAGLRPETRAQVRAALVRGLDPVVVVDHVAKALDALRELYDRCAPTGGPRPACSVGCHYCCHMRVEVTAPEVFSMARGLRQYTMVDLHVRVQKTAQQLRGISGRDHHLAQIPCPLLSEAKSCVMYARRPLGCRRAHCIDASLCAHAHEHPDTKQLLLDIPELSFHLSAPVVGYFEGMVLAGIPPHQYELCAALDIALRTPDIERAWQNGEDALLPARTRTDEEVRALLLHGRAGTETLATGG